MAESTVEHIHDEPATLPVSTSDVLHAGRVFDLVTEDVDLGDGGTVTREFLKHPGAVAIVALDEQERVLLIRQYRHPVRAYLWEVPAGLLDVPGEPLLGAAQRELAEEADLTAASWHTLADYYTSPGGSDEGLRVFLARDLDEIPEDDRYQRGEEELGMPTMWVPLEEAVRLVQTGALHNPSAVVGVLAAHAARAGDWTGLRPADAAWVR
ncbi:NUDIX domain-containing protein [Pseudactinotalea sp.]|uniref:NUDIX domain-containing protein n=1 Tax=Pseudactinotalea sp. TaxID=1926260 RepID=UPI003B3AAF21